MLIFVECRHPHCVEFVEYIAKQTKFAWYILHMYPKAYLYLYTPYLPTLEFYKWGQIRENLLKPGTFLYFLYITVQRILQKEGHMIKSLYCLHPK